MSRLAEISVDALAWIVGAGLALVVLIAFGTLVDGYADHLDRHERCLKQATNGYDSKQCH